MRLNGFDTTGKIGLLIRLITLIEVESRQLGIDAEKYTNPLADELRDLKRKTEA